MAQQGAATANNERRAESPQSWVLTLKRLASGVLKIRLEDLDAFVRETEAHVREVNTCFQNAKAREQYWELYLRFNKWHDLECLQRDSKTLQRECEELEVQIEQLRGTHNANCARFCGSTVRMFESFRGARGPRDDTTVVTSGSRRALNILDAAMALLMKYNYGNPAATYRKVGAAPRSLAYLQGTNSDEAQETESVASGSRDEQDMDQDHDALSSEDNEDILQLGELMETLRMEEEEEAQEGSAMEAEEEIDTEGHLQKMAEVLETMKERRQTMLTLRCKILYNVQSVRRVRQKILDRCNEKRRLSDWEGRYLFGM